MASGPALTLTQMEARARLLNQDTDSTNAPGMASADYTSLINAAYFIYFDRIEPRYKWISATSANLSLAAGDYVKQITDASAPRIREIKAICYEGTNIAALSKTQGFPIKREPDFQALLYKIGKDVVAGFPSAPTNEGQPTSYAVFRPATEPGNSQVTRGVHNIYFYPVSDATYYFSLIFSQSPTALATGSDTPDVSVEGSYVIAAIAGAQAAVLLRRPPDMIQGILATVPEDVATLFSFNKLELQAKVKDRQ